MTFLEGISGDGLIGLLDEALGGGQFIEPGGASERRGASEHRGAEDAEVLGKGEEAVDLLVDLDGLTDEEVEALLSEME